MKQRAQSDHVYVVTGGNVQKIGITSRPKERLSELRRYGHRIALVMIWHRPQYAAEIEREVKHKLKSLRHYGLEWFRIPLDDFLVYVRSLVGWFDNNTPIIEPKFTVARKGKRVIVTKRKK